MGLKDQLLYLSKAETTISNISKLWMNENVGELAR